MLHDMLKFFLLYGFHLEFPDFYTKYTGFPTADGKSRKNSNAGSIITHGVENMPHVRFILYGFRPAAVPARAKHNEYNYNTWTNVFQGSV
ncbi:MAG: hypothetical protein Q4F84_09725 [Fibrobacter sp.]|nr:hypothetical protein [Fibrobacter sp.]